MPTKPVELATKLSWVDTSVDGILDRYEDVEETAKDFVFDWLLPEQVVAYMNAEAITVTITNDGAGKNKYTISDTTVIKPGIQVFNVVGCTNTNLNKHYAGIFVDGEYIDTNSTYSADDAGTIELPLFRQIDNAIAYMILFNVSLALQELKAQDVLTSAKHLGNGEIKQFAQMNTIDYEYRCYMRARMALGLSFTSKEGYGTELERRNGVH